MPRTPISPAADAENAVVAMTAALTAASSLSSGSWRPEYEPQAAFRYYLGTTAETPWICEQAIELPLRMLPAPVSPDGYVIVCSRWTSDPAVSVEDVFEVLHTFFADVVLFQGPDPIPLGESRDSPTVAAIESAYDPSRDTGSRAGPLVREQPGQAVASWIRDTSDMTASELGALFPVARESYQRWVNGTMEPSPDNLRRLLSLQRLFVAIRRDKGSIRAWLHAPIADGAAQTPYDWLRSGRISAVWNALLGRSHTGSVEVNRQVGRIVSVRSDYAPTSVSETDDLDDWPDESE